MPLYVVFLTVLRHSSHLVDLILLQSLPLSFIIVIIIIIIISIIIKISLFVTSFMNFSFHVKSVVIILNDYWTSQI